MTVYRKQPWRKPSSPDQVQGDTGMLRQFPMPIGNFIADPLDPKLKQRRTQSVCLTGHRFLSQADTALLEALDGLLECLYSLNYRDFLCGGAIGFDTFAAERILALRSRHPDVRLISCIPCEKQDLKWPRRDQEHYRRMLYLSDEVRILSPFYYEGCMQVRNRYMVDRSSICVSYMKRLRGGTFSTVDYAISQDLILVNLAIPGAAEEFRQAFC